MNNDIFNDNEHCHIKWYHYFIHLGYYLPYWIRFFFSKPFNRPNQVKDLDLLDQVKLMLDVQADASDAIIIDKCKKFIHLHRIIENTRARRRLEKWASRIIATYLFVVLCIVLCNYIHIPIIANNINLKITDQVIIIILSTTTVNIIGLGLIVLRGHFLSKDKNNEIDENAN